MFYFKGSTKDIDFNDFIDPESLFHDLKFKRMRFEDLEKIKWNLNRN